MGIQNNRLNLCVKMRFEKSMGHSVNLMEVADAFLKRENWGGPDLGGCLRARTTVGAHGPQIDAEDVVILALYFNE